jgi:hypothetical protein
MAATPWNFEAEYIQSCNCDYGCPCNFNGLPTYGNCEALVAWKIRHGKFDTTQLDGVTFALGAWWPKAIHMGNGVGAYYVDPKATAEQRTAIEQIVSGKHGGGVFEIFPRTWKATHPVKSAPIEFHYAEYESWFKVDGIGEVHSEKIRNPVSGAEFQGTIEVPGGIVFKKGIVSSIKRWWVRDDDILAVHENRNGHVCVVKFSQDGCVG